MPRWGTASQNLYHQGERAHQRALLQHWSVKVTEVNWNDPPSNALGSVRPGLLCQKSMQEEVITVIMVAPDLGVF